LNEGVTAQRGPPFKRGGEKAGWVWTGRLGEGERGESGIKMIIGKKGDGSAN